MRSWVLLTYKVPPEPSASRVQVWRKLKRLGALLIHDAVWVLPADPRTVEHFQWLAAEVQEMGGEAAVWESRPSLTGQEEALVREFQTQAERGYQEILTEIERGDADLPALSRRYQQVRARDYFQCGLEGRVREALISARGMQS